MAEKYSWDFGDNNLSPCLTENKAKEKKPTISKFFKFFFWDCLYLAIHWTMGPILPKKKMKKKKQNSNITIQTFLSLPSPWSCEV